MSEHPPLHRNLQRAHGFEAIEVEGVIPDDLVGTLIRVGPGLFERFGVRVPHPFEADGVVSAVRIDGASSAFAAAAVIESQGYLAEQAAGRRLYGSGTSWPRRLRNNFAQRSKNTGNTSAWVWNDRLFALMEGGKPTELDPATLATLGEREFDGVVTRTFSAHPHRVAALETTFNFGIRYGKTTSLELFAAADAGSIRKLGEVELGWAGLVHDFVATETHLVFVVCPVELVLWRALLGVGGFGKLFEWKPERGCELLVVPLADTTKVERIACDPYWVWHFGNGFRRGDDLVFDLCRYVDFTTLEAIAGTAQVSVPPAYHRAVLDLRAGRVRSEAVLEGGAEFPRIHPRCAGAEHRFAWIRRPAAISRLEIETGAQRTWTPDSALAVSEPVVVPRAGPSAGADEADVWVLVLCHHATRERSCVVVLDGSAPEAGPVATLWFDQTIPMTFHGTWMAPAAAPHEARA